MANTVRKNNHNPDISKSLDMLQKARKIMHPVSQTLAKAPGQFSEGVCPVYADRAKGNRIIDIDGNEYLDYYAAIGPISLGYAYDKVDNAIRVQLAKGITFSLMHHLEYDVCQLLNRIIPNAEAVRIGKTGAEMCSAAVRVARAFTHREKILCCGYHGWHDWYIATTTRNHGIPDSVSALTQTFKYNDIDDLKSKLDNTVAAVILEPFVFEYPKDGYLQSILELCKQNGTLLIFDEMWTGFRIAIGGAQEYFNIKPDLAVYSKAVANGMPIAFLTGREDIMKLFDSEVFCYSTFGGEALSLAATMATIEELIEKNVPEHLNTLGSKLKEGLNAMIDIKNLRKYMECNGYPCRTILNFTPLVKDPLSLYAFIQEHLLRFGILWSKFHNISYSFSEQDIEYTLFAYDEILNTVKQKLESENDVKSLLTGKPLDVVFRLTKF